MPSFPKLRSGAVAQYGSANVFEFRTQVHRFLDGSEQTHRWRANAGRRWVIQAQRLDESELASVETFFAEMQGAAGQFDFEDPLTGDVVGNCSFDTDQLVLRSAGVQQGSVTITIRENLT